MKFQAKSKIRRKSNITKYGITFSLICFLSLFLLAITSESVIYEQFLDIKIKDQFYYILIGIATISFILTTIATKDVRFVGNSTVTNQWINYRTQNKDLTLKIEEVKEFELRYFKHPIRRKDLILFTSRQKQFNFYN